MLRSRAITEVARMGASDALFGVIYTPEELGVETDGDGEVVHTVTRVPQPSQTGADRMREALRSAPAPQNGSSEGSQAETPVAGGEAGSIPAGNPSEESAPAPITDAQMRKLSAAVREIGLTDRQQILDGIGRVIGRTIGSRKELTKDEAVRVIDSLEQRLAAARPAEQPAEQPAGDVVDAEVVEDQPTPPVAGENADAVWDEVMAYARQHGIDVAEDFSARMGGLIPDDASAGELRHYLGLLQGGTGAAA